MVRRNLTSYYLSEAVFVVMVVQMLRLVEVASYSVAVEEVVVLVERMLIEMTLTAAAEAEGPADGNTAVAGVPVVANAAVGSNLGHSTAAGRCRNMVAGVEGQRTLSLASAGVVVALELELAQHSLALDRKSLHRCR